ncbi:hypothetical protein AQJ84_02920 [Streptomyces resistomycificus]|nr:hypothetical protein AQJ84_02920 [Streptomyces resistomycificus]
MRPGDRRHLDGGERKVLEVMAEWSRPLDFVCPVVEIAVPGDRDGSFEPKIAKERLTGVACALYRQRMDFLLLAPDHSRIVIEGGGVQHYGRPNPPDAQGRVGYAAVARLHSEMVAEDRRIRLAGYEIYRCGGWELTGAAAPAPGPPRSVAPWFSRHRGSTGDRRTAAAAPASGTASQGRGSSTSRSPVWVS